MAKYICSVCGYVYDETRGAPESNIPPGTKWEDIPETFTCFICGAKKDKFFPE